MKHIIHRIVTGCFLGIATWFLFIYFPPFVFSALLLGILTYILIYEWPNFFPVRSASFWFIMPFYPILPFFLLIAMNQHELYRNLLFVVMVIVSTFDTGAYVIGNLFGKRKIAPSISPSKTWEGFFGGYLCAVSGFAFLLWNENKLNSWSVILILTLILCLIESAGDFFESWLKRRANIKDAGAALPGHGGFLDRMDGILFAVSFSYIFKSYIVQLLS